MKIIKLEPSPLKGKRYRVTLDTQSHYDFGLRGGHTYVDGESDLIRKNYQLRHLGNKREKYLIENFIPSPSLFSFFLLWGKSRSVRENIKYLNSKIK